MKRIVLSLALSVICLAVTVGSFLTNDLTAYRDWAMTHHPKLADKFDRHFSGFPGQETRTPRDYRMGPPENRKAGDAHHEDNGHWSGNPPPMPSRTPAPADMAPAAPSTPESPNNG